MSMTYERARYWLRVGKLDQFRGAYAEAGQHYEQAWTTIEGVHQQKCGQEAAVQACPACALDVAAVRWQQAKLADEQGAYELAEEGYVQALAVYERCQGRAANRAQAREYIQATCALALFYHQRWQEYDLASMYYRRAADGAGRLLGERAPETLQVQAAQALLEVDRLLLCQERPARAEIERQWVQVATKYEIAFQACGSAPLRRNIAQGFLANNLATVYQRSGDLTRAARWYEQALALYRDHGWADHFSHALLLTNVAQCLGEQGEIDAARRQYARAEEIYRQPRAFYQVADFYSQYVSIFAEAGRKEQLGKLDIALEIYAADGLSPGLGHERVLQALQAYGALCQYANERADLDGSYQRLIQRYQAYQSHAGERPGPLIQLARVQHAYAYWLGTTCRAYDAAGQAYRAALEAYRQVPARFAAAQRKLSFQCRKALRDGLLLLQRCNNFLIEDLRIQWMASEERARLDGLKKALQDVYTDPETCAAYQRYDPQRVAAFESARGQFAREIDFSERAGASGGIRNRRGLAEGGQPRCERADQRGLILLW